MENPSLSRYILVQHGWAGINQCYRQGMANSIAKKQPNLHKVMFLELERFDLNAWLPSHWMCDNGKMQFSHLWKCELNNICRLF